MSVSLPHVTQSHSFIIVFLDSSIESKEIFYTGWKHKPRPMEKKAWLNFSLNQNVFKFLFRWAAAETERMLRINRISTLISSRERKKKYPFETYKPTEIQMRV